MDWLLCGGLMFMGLVNYFGVSVVLVRVEMLGIALTTGLLLLWVCGFIGGAGGVYGAEDYWLI